MRFFKTKIDHAIVSPIHAAAKSRLLSPESAAQENYKVLEAAALANERRCVDPHKY